MRTAQEIVRQTNQLARRMYSANGYAVPDDYRFYEARNARANFMWAMACLAQEELTKTDPNDAVAELRDSVAL